MWRTRSVVPGTSSRSGRRALIVGWRGGVGRALLGLLAHHDLGRRIVERLDALFLLDLEDGAPPAQLRDARVLRAGASLDAALADHRIDQVIEVADVDTADTSAACVRRGADFVSASMRRDGDPEQALTMIGARWPLPDRRVAIRESHLIGSGMNPGIVNALALAGMAELARRVGSPATIEALDIYAIHVTELDTTADAGGEGRPDDRDEFAMSWSPRHALEEILEPHAMYVAAGELARADHPPHVRGYLARCGATDTEAMLVPHEELVSLGHRFPTIELGFFYAVADAARRALRRHPERTPDQWPTRRLYPPQVTRLSGFDRVGVLIASRRHGELWIGYETPVTAGSRYGTNATLLQTAAGMLAGWTLLGTRPGIHLVEELDWREHLAIVEQILGPRQIHHVPDAPVRTIAERMVP
jgi:hypothetical protein